MPNNSAIDPLELVGTLLWAVASGVAYALWGPKAALTTAVALMLGALVVVVSYLLLAGCPIDG